MNRSREMPRHFRHHFSTTPQDLKSDLGRYDPAIAIHVLLYYNISSSSIWKNHIHIHREMVKE